jgi:hypothetical protein
MPIMDLAAREAPLKAELNSRFARDKYGTKVGDLLCPGGHQNLVFSHTNGEQGHKPVIFLSVRCDECGWVHEKKICE